MGDNRFPDRIDKGNVRTEESTVIIKLLKEWDFSSTDLGNANNEAEDQESHFMYIECMNKMLLSFTRLLIQMNSY